jgi:hypothetical protein
MLDFQHEMTKSTKRREKQRLSNRANEPREQYSPVVHVGRFFIVHFLRDALCSQFGKLNEDVDS